MGKSITAVLITLVVALTGAAGYLIYQNQKLTNKQISSQTPSPIVSTDISPSGKNGLASPAPSPSQSASPFTPTLALTQNAIKTNVNSKNYQGLLPYMTTPKVFVTLQATECCGDKTPQEAIEQMSYIDQGLPFDFNQDSTTIQNLKSKNPQLADKFIGTSTVNENMIAFGVDIENHISNIEMSASVKLYNQ